jgi:hypothetical protein
VVRNTPILSREYTRKQAWSEPAKTAWPGASRFRQGARTVRDKIPCVSVWSANDAAAKATLTSAERVGEVFKNGIDQSGGHRI